MASSSFNTGIETKIITGTLTADTGDYFISNVIPDNYAVVSGAYLTTYNQYRPLSVGQSGNSLIIVGATAGMANRPYRVILCRES